MLTLKFTRRRKQASGVLCPGQISARCSSAEQFSWTGKAQQVQNLLLDRIQLGKLSAEQVTIGVADKDNTVVGKGFQDARDSGPRLSRPSGIRP